MARLRVRASPFAMGDYATRCKTERLHAEPQVFSEQRQSFDVRLVHERAEILKLRARYAFGEKAHDVLDAVLVCLQHVERIAHQDEFALLHAIGSEDVLARRDAVREYQRRLLLGR